MKHKAATIKQKQMALHSHPPDKGGKGDFTPFFRQSGVPFLPP